jgi:uncharacterized repeat protein (TIGR01451 family)
VRLVRWWVEPGGRISLAVTAAVGAGWLCALPADAATVLGSAASTGQACASNPPITWVQEPSAAPSYAAPSDGVITTWSYQSNTTAGDVKLKVFRPTATPGTFLTLGDSRQTVPASTLNSFAARISVKAGDVLGLTVLSAGMACVAPGASSGDIAWNDGSIMGPGGDPSPGTVHTFGIGPFSSFRTDIAASLEPDADGDGFGDETQDRCPGTPGSVQGCPNADLSVTKFGIPGKVNAGENVSYTLTAKNNGPDAAPGVTITDSVSLGALLVASTGSCNQGAVINCSVGTLAPGATASVTLVLKLFGAGAETDTGTVGSAALDAAAQNATGAGDPNPANNSATVTTMVVGPAPVLANPPPVLANPAQLHSTWALGNKLASFAKKPTTPVGTTFSFTLNEQARVSFAFTQQDGGRKVKGRCVAQTKKNRSKPRCRLRVTPGTLSFTGHAGLNKVVFQGLISRSKKLRPGRYTLVITATSVAGKRSAPQSLRFTIVEQ